MGHLHQLPSHSMPDPLQYDIPPLLPPFHFPPQPASFHQSNLVPPLIHADILANPIQPEVVVPFIPLNDRLDDAINVLRTYAEPLSARSTGDTVNMPNGQIDMRFTKQQQSLGACTTNPLSHSDAFMQQLLPDAWVTTTPIDSSLDVKFGSKGTLV